MQLMRYEEQIAASEVWFSKYQTICE